jgi:hypothetical protein
MTDFEYFSSEAYRFLHSPEVATLRAHYNNFGRLCLDRVIKDNSAQYIDLSGVFMFEIVALSREALYNKMHKVESAAMA